MSCAFCLMCEWIIILFRRSSSLNLCAKGFWGQREKNWFRLLSKCLKRKSMSFAIKQQRRLMDVLELLHTYSWRWQHFCMHYSRFDARRFVALSLSLCVWFFSFSSLFEQLKRSEKHKTLDGDQSGAHTYTLSLARSMRFRFLNWNRRARSTKQQLGGLSKLHCETKYGKHAQTRSIRNTALCVCARTPSIP